MHENERSFDISLCIASLLVSKHATVVLESWRSKVENHCTANKKIYVLEQCWSGAKDKSGQQRDTSPIHIGLTSTNQTHQGLNAFVQLLSRSQIAMPLIMPSSSRLHDAMSSTSQPNHSPSTNPPPIASESTTTPPSTNPIILSIPLPLSPHTSLRVQLTPLATSILAFLTTTSPETTSSLSSLGSLVYAMPNVRRH